MFDCKYFTTLWSAFHQDWKLSGNFMGHVGTPYILDKDYKEFISRLKNTFFSCLPDVIHDVWEVDKCDLLKQQNFVFKNWIICFFLRNSNYWLFFRFFFPRRQYLFRMLRTSQLCASKNFYFLRFYEAWMSFYAFK